MIYYKINKWAEQQNWHPWFAWYPVKVEKMPDGHYKYAWLEKVLKCSYYVYHGAVGSYQLHRYKEIILFDNVKQKE